MIRQYTVQSIALFCHLALVVLGVGIGGLWSDVASAAEAAPVFAETGPLRDASGLFQPTNESAKRVLTARVMHADYPLLRRDFPELRTLTTKQIDTILLEKAGAVAASQTRPNAVNTEIMTGESIPAFRPRGYRRALVFPFFNGLIDAKGAGALSPTQGNHSDGLGSLAEMLREFLLEKAMSRVLKHANYAPGTVQTYAVIDLGFENIDGNGKHRPVGLVLRQAHEREVAAGLMKPKLAERIEKLFRRYGVVSDWEAMAYDYQTIDRRNVQGSKFGSIVDFGAMRSLAKGTILRSSPVQPDPLLGLPEEFFGPTFEEGRNPYLGDDTPGHDFEKLVAEWRSGRIDRLEVAQFFRKRLSPLRTRYQRTCNSLFTERY